MKRAYQITLVVAFSLLCCVPGTVTLMHPEDPGLWNVEPVAYPPFAASLSWATAFEKYFVANFGLKRQLVQLNNLIGYGLIRDLQNDSVMVGKKGWLYLRQDNGWLAFRSEDRLTPDAVRAWTHALAGARDFLAGRKTPLVFIVPPAKESIYPENLPWSATRASSFTRLDEMVELFQRAELNYIDLRGTFAKEREQFQLYDRLESHWNGHGARIAAQLLMQRVAAALGRPASYAELDAHVVPSPSTADLAYILALHEIVSEGSSKLVPNRSRARRVVPPASVLAPTRSEQTYMVFEVDDPSLPTAVILRDSYAQQIMPVLTEKFRRSVWLWTQNLNLSLVNEENPDVVIVQVAERFYADAPPHFSDGRPRRSRQRR